MERYLIVLIVSVGYCSEHNVIPLSHQSELYKYEEKEYKKSEVKSTHRDDLEIINDDYEKYVNRKENNNERDERDYQRKRRYSNEELDKMYGYTGPTANDEPENLIRPCAFDDWECIRKFFASNGRCQPAYGPIPDPLYQDIYTLFFPSANLTGAIPGLQIRGLSSAKIIEFYVNKKSGNLVFAFEMQNFNVVAPRAYLRYRRTAKESIILAGFASINFRSTTFTAVIPGFPALRLDLADSHADVHDATPALVSDPDFVASPDPDVLTGYAALVGRLPISIQEGVFFEAQLLTALYIQKNICDFGLNLISV